MYYTIEEFLNRPDITLSKTEFKELLNSNMPSVNNVVNANFDSTELTLLLNQTGLEGVRPVEINNRMYMIGIKDDKIGIGGAEYVPMIDPVHLIVESL